MPTQAHDDYIKSVLGIDVTALRSGRAKAPPAAPAAGGRDAAANGTDPSPAAVPVDNANNGQASLGTAPNGADTSSATPAATVQKGQPALGAGADDATAPGSGAGDKAALKATDTIMYFAFDSADLTPENQDSLKSYAANYLKAGSTDPVTVQGFASADGDPSHNKELATKRAKAVMDFLVKQGLPQAKVSMQGQGPTKQYGSLQENRRAIVDPKPPVALAQPANPPQPATVKPTSPVGNPLDLTSPANKQALQQTVQNIQEAEDWIRKHLKDSGLRPDPLNDKGDHVLYNNKTTALDDVVSETVRAGKNASIKAPDLVTEDRVRKIVTDVLLDSIPTVKSGGKNPAKTSISIQYQFVPFTDHTSLKDGKGSTDQPGHQIQLQITAKMHGEDESGVEIQGQLTGTLFADGANLQIKWQQVQGGAQIAWVQNFFDNNLQVSPQLAVSFGGSRAVMNQSQTIEWTPTGQVTAGGQVTYKVPGFKGQLQVGLQGQVGVTGPSGSQATFDKTWVFTLTYQF
jgi:outer membrane protein OmpA-like peptidoglycan-associated protein